ncbi:hypothetical protein AVEN_82428-1 [Araneus ventricosus]|uniref:Uncharacterized protein n=1 Tax=Araneus ventricosus TaxID=182803 RepID=A0A4Y2ER56_ARAVE|nr:hypothetical protein AVEN_82428-1 [Araneus ventricosus]
MGIVITNMLTLTGYWYANVILDTRSSMATAKVSQTNEPKNASCKYQIKEAWILDSLVVDIGDGHGLHQLM